jgi:hypothetical protein
MTDPGLGITAPAGEEQEATQITSCYREALLSYAGLMSRGQGMAMIVLFAIQQASLEIVFLFPYYMSHEDRLCVGILWDEKAMLCCFVELQEEKDMNGVDKKILGKTSSRSYS